MTLPIHSGARPMNDSQPMHRLRSADDVLLAGDSWGDPDGIPVIRLHGAGQTRHSWSATGMMLGGAGFFAVAFDAVVTVTAVGRQGQTIVTARKRLTVFGCED
jgi:hypothetical protein